MKRILLMLTIAALATATKAQDTTTVINPDFGIFLGQYDEKRTFGTDSTVVTHRVDYMYPEFSENRLRFVYRVRSYVDNQQIRSDNVRLDVPLNHTIQGKKVHEWITMTISSQDSVIYKTLSTELYKARVLSGKR